MLVRLTSSTSGEVIMFAEQVRRLFDIVGKECTARGVFTLEQLPDAVTRLRRAVEDEKQEITRTAEAGRSGRDRENARATDKDADEADPDKNPAVAVGLGQRAHPLIGLMERTQKDEGFILWEAANDF